MFLKEDVVHICNGILVSHKKGMELGNLEMWMGLASITQSEVRQKEREGKKVSYINRFMLNLEKWHRFTNFMDWNRDVDIEKRHGEGRVGQIRILRLTYIH